MSRPRVITGVDDRGRPKAQWADAPAEPPAYAFMEPAYQPVVERRQATPEELAAARAREAEPSHLTTDNSRTVPTGLWRERHIDGDAARLQASRQRGAERHVEVVAARRPSPAIEEEPAVPYGPKPEPQPLDTFQSLSEAAANASEAWARRQAAEMAWTIASEALEAALGEVEAMLHAPLVIKKLSYTATIDVEEARLDELSDLAIGEAMGGAIGDALAEKARGNLEVLETMVEPAPIGGGPALRGVMTAHESKVLAATIAHNGDRKAVAKELGLTASINVEQALERIAKRGLLPISLIPLLPARFAKYSGV